MSDIWFPSWLCPRTAYIGLDDFTAADESATTGAIQTSSLYGTRRWRLRMDFPALSSNDGTLQIFEGLLASLRGRANRIWINVPGQRRRGSFPTSELLPNNTFGNGAFGWSASGSEISISTSDRTLRITRVSGANSRVVSTASGSSVVQYAPYAARAMFLRGKGAVRQDVRLGSSAGGLAYGSTPISSQPGMVTLSSVPYGASAYFGMSDWSGLNKTAGDYIEVPYASLSRCSLVDNGTNLLLRSGDLSHAYWNKTRSSVTPDAIAAPDGTITADSIVEDSSSGTHMVGRTLNIDPSLDIMISCAFKAGTRTWAALRLQENTGNQSAFAYFNLSSGVAGSIDSQGNWLRLRSFISSLGDGYYYCSLIGRPSNDSTSVSAFLCIASADLAASYTGNGSGNIYAWRATLAYSSVPSRLVLTTTTESAGTSQSGGTLQIKGLPASARDLAKAGDMAQIVLPSGGQLVRLTASLDTDASGMGHMQFEPILKASPADNAAVIFHEPMGRFMLASGSVGTELRPGVFGESTLEFIEA